MIEGLYGVGEGLGWALFRALGGVAVGVVAMGLLMTSRGFAASVTRSVYPEHVARDEAALARTERARAMARERRSSPRVNRILAISSSGRPLTASAAQKPPQSQRPLNSFGEESSPKA